MASTILRAVMNEVFGEENLIACMVWKRRQVADNRNLNQMSVDHEYVLAYGRGAASLLGTAKDLTKYQNPDHDPRGPWMNDNMTGLATREQRPNLHYSVSNPTTGLSYPPHPTRGWIYEPKTMARMIAEDRILWPANPDGRPRLKRFLSEIRSNFTGFSSVIQGAGYTTDGTRELTDLFGGKPLSFPKPTPLIRTLCEQTTDGNETDIILDFFAGSCTTAHAVLELNRSDGGNRQFIVVQLPEPTGNTDFVSIADFGKERIRRVIHRMQAEDKGKLTTGHGGPEDLGFKVLQLNRSNYRAWRDFDAGDVGELQTLFDRFESPLVDGWKPEDVLVEVMLIEGFPLDSIVGQRPEFRLNRVQQVSSDMLAHRLFVCLDAHVYDETVAALTMSEEDIFICLDSVLGDEAKVQLEDGRRVKVI